VAFFSPPILEKLLETYANIPMNQVDFVNGKTRVYAIVGDPIEQVRSPEMVTWEMQKRDHNAVLIPMHIARDEFDTVMPQIMRMRNLDGLIFTIPFKAQAIALAKTLGPQASQIGAINALKKHSNGAWSGEIFDGIGCVEAFKQRGITLQDKRLQLIGLGGAGSAICVALAYEKPKLLRLFDINAQTTERMAKMVNTISPQTVVEVGLPLAEGIDILLNASPVGMLSDARLPLAVQQFKKELIVFDAIVMPENTPLLSLAQDCGCQVVRGREMMLGQISKIVDYFFAP
jgi:shikimate dehydrogenase